MNLKKIKVIGFDADDTLWVNETHYRDIEEYFCNLMADYGSSEILKKELFKTEMQNMDIYGYGAKGFILSLIETALRVSNNQASPQIINKVLKTGKRILNAPVELLPDVEETLEALCKKFKLILITKGDLLDQQRKLRQSGLSGYFNDIEIISEKNENNYRETLDRLDIHSSEFLMVGNSLKSDILPVVKIGGFAFHIPFEITWQHEEVLNIEAKEDNPVFRRLNNIKEILSYL